MLDRNTKWLSLPEWAVEQELDAPVIAQLAKEIFLQLGCDITFLI
jgi:hypothetical protein